VINDETKKEAEQELAEVGGHVANGIIENVAEG
jgi:hypothetical protein